MTKANKKIKKMSVNDSSFNSIFERLVKVGIALSAETDKMRLIETILLEAKTISRADGGTIYIRGDMITDPISGNEVFEPSAEGNQLKFEIMRTDSLNIAAGGTTGKEVSLPPLYIVSPKTGEKNLKNVATASILRARLIHVPNVYKSKKFDFSGTKQFDLDTGYQSKSFLTVPLQNNQGGIIGVLQLLNAQSSKPGEVISFRKEIQPIVTALASQAAVALDNQLLLAGQKKLLDSFIKLIAAAIDAKSPYTGKHCQRVPELSMMLADAAVASHSGSLSNFSLSPDERYEMEIAALLHDCGKVTTPEHVIDKATKLETIYNRIHEIRTRFEVVKRDCIIDTLKKVIDGKESRENIQPQLDEKLKKLDDDFTFVANCNLGGESMKPAEIARIKTIAKTEWFRTLDNQLGLSQDEAKYFEHTPYKKLPVKENILADHQNHKIPHSKNSREAKKENQWKFLLNVPRYKYNFGEIYNLCIEKGTLTAEERYKINDHISQTIIMLEKLPFPKNLKRVPEYAGGHHEKMDGSGYPRGLKQKDMSIPARIMAIADIFEALTANDRPYKKPKKLSDCIKIMVSMKNNAHIDSDLFELFLLSGVYKTYAKKYLMPEQIDITDISKYVS